MSLGVDKSVLFKEKQNVCPTCRALLLNPPRWDLKALCLKLAFLPSPLFTSRQTCIQRGRVPINTAAVFSSENPWRAPGLGTTLKSLFFWVFDMSCPLPYSAGPG